MNITEKCTGCMACYNACPFNAIEIIQNEKGFYEPHIIEEKCKKCKKYGLPCEAVDLRKQKKIIETAKDYIQKNDLYNKNFRFDVIEILIQEKIFSRPPANAYGE